jgi:ribonuclease HI
MISANVSLSGNKTNKTINSSMRDFTILKNFRINLHPTKAPIIKEVFWQPPLFNWIKGNTDDAANSSTAAYGGFFRNHLANFMGGFAENIGNKSAFFAELSGAIKAIEIAYENHWLNFWLETDSVLVVKAFSNLSLIPWSLRNRWMNCLLMTRSMIFFVSHVYREGNVCADVLANLGLGLLELTFGNIAPLPVCNSFARDKFGLPNFRFTP